MKKKERAAAAVALLEGLYPEAICSLDAIEPYQLLIATRLSAQCTDARVNLITPVLFEQYPTLESLAQAAPQDIEPIIFSCGFYRAKSKDIVLMSQMLINDYGGVVPDTIDELTKLPGVGRKTANLIVGDVYGKPAVVADTHCIRICKRLGLTTSKDPYKVELELKRLLDPAKSNDFCHRIVLFGRAFCTARSPKCDGCPLFDVCKYKA